MQPKKIPYWNAPAKGPYTITLACQTCRYLLLISLGVFAWLTLLTAIRSAKKKPSTAPCFYYIRRLMGSTTNVEKVDDLTELSIPKNGLSTEGYVTLLANLNKNTGDHAGCF